MAPKSIMPKPIDLGRNFNDMLRIEPLDTDKAHYPDLCIEGDDERLANMPDQGVAEIKYRIRSRTHREEKGSKGKDRYSCSLRLEVLSIDPPESKKKKNGDSDGGARKAMDNYFRDK